MYCIVYVTLINPTTPFSRSYQGMVKLEGTNVVSWNVSCCQRFCYLSHDATLICKTTQEGSHHEKNPVTKGLYSGTFDQLRSTGSSLRTFKTKNRRNSPKPKGCPPILTIFQSSPEALVKRTLFGNLEEKK